MFKGVDLSMKMNLLNDILKGLEALERQQDKPVQSQKQDTQKPGKFNLLGKMVAIKRETGLKGNPPGKTSDVSTTRPKTYANYAETYGQKESYNFDPETVVFFGVKGDSAHHHAKVRDLDMISRIDPSLAHRILTLS